MIFPTFCELRYVKHCNKHLTQFEISVLNLCELLYQVLDWLSHSPTEIESYIRPGCVVLTIYLRQTEASWDNVGF